MTHLLCDHARSLEQIYSFGGVSVFLDQNVTFTEMPRGSGRWSPIGLEELLQVAGYANAAPAHPPPPIERQSAANSASTDTYGGLD